GGIDIFKTENDYIYSRNLLANQRDSGTGTGLNKSFSVLNRHYNLIVSKYGLEMYAYRIDPTNHSNLLSFFDLNESGEISFNNRGANHTHFRKTMQPDQVEHIKTNFYLLRDKLYDRVSLKNSMIDCTENNQFDLSGFYRI